MKNKMRLIIFVIFATTLFLPINIANAETIIPTMLTKKETPQFDNVNILAKNAFKNIQLKIKTDSFPPSISPLPDPSDTSVFNINKADGLIKYDFDADTGILKYIGLSQQTNSLYPQITKTYDYPKDNLLFITIQTSPINIFYYNEEGKYVDFSSFMDIVQKEIKSCGKVRRPFCKMSSDSLRTLINFKISKHGELLAYKINESSKNNEFDNAAIQALKDSFPFNSIPQTFDWDSMEVQFSFKLNVIGLDNPCKMVSYDSKREKQIILPEAKLMELKNQYSKISNDKLIWLTLDVLKKSNHSDIVDTLLLKNLSKRPIEISFKNLYRFGKTYENFDGLGWKKGEQLYIFINEKHMEAPPEAIASLIARLSVFQDAKLSKNELIFATVRETSVWKDFIEANPKLDSNGSPLVKRENKIFEMYKKGNFTNKIIKEYVNTDPSHSNLPETSPGFETLE